MAFVGRSTVFTVGFLLSSSSLGAEPPKTVPATRGQIQLAVDRAVEYVQAESAAWMKQRKCASCHHAAMALWALSEADRQGFTVDRKFFAETTDSILGSRANLIATKVIPGPNDPPDTRPLAQGVRTGAIFLAVAAQEGEKLSVNQKQVLQEVAAEALQKQRPDGSWDFFLSRPPVNENQTTDHAWILLALQGGAGRTPSSEETKAFENGLAWFEKAQPTEAYQEKVLKALLFLRTTKPAGQIQSAVRDLIALQRPDGGWGQTPALPSDAFATGQTLYVLVLAGWKLESAPVRRAADFLVSTQKPDGGWPMTSRSSPDGKPGGSSKLLTPIQTAAASWAAMGLARLAPKETGTTSVEK